MDARQKEILNGLLDKIEFRDDEPTDDDFERLALVFTDWGPDISFPAPTLRIAKWVGIHWVDQDDQGGWEGPVKCVVAYAWI